MLWRGAADWPIYHDGRTMVIAGGMAAKFVFYPIHSDPAHPARRLTNWAVMAKTADPATPSRAARTGTGPANGTRSNRSCATAFGWISSNPLALIRASGTFYEYPLCDRDPLPRWSFGRATLLGDAAHPMYPVGSNGASQAVLDARSLARHLAAGAAGARSTAAYDAERRPMTAEIVLNNRKGGPERVIDVMEERAPDGFTDVDAIASHAEREAIVRGYASIAGFARDQVNRLNSAWRRQEVHLVQAGQAHDLARIGHVVDRQEQIPQAPGRRDPEQAGDVRLAVIEQTVRDAARQPDQVAGLRGRVTARPAAGRTCRPACR